MKNKPVVKKVKQKIVSNEDLDHALISVLLKIAAGTSVRKTGEIPSYADQLGAIDLLFKRIGSY